MPAFYDAVDTIYKLWDIKFFLPFVPGIIPFSYTHPILHLLVYQYTSTWKSFAIANTFMSLFFAFAVLPFYAWAGILWLGGWRYFYSFLVTMGITFLARAVVIWLAKIEQKHATQPNRVVLSPKLQPAMKLFERENDNE